MKNISRRTDTQNILSYFFNERGTLATVTISGLIYNAGLVLMPWFEGQFVQYTADIFGGKKTFSDMLFLALSYLAVAVAIQGLRYLKRFSVRRFGNNVSRRMKSLLYKNLLSDPRVYSSSESGSVITKAVSDTDDCAEGMRKFTTEVFDTGVVMIAYVTMLFCYDARLAIISCIFPPFAYMLAQIMKKTVCKYTAALRESSGRLSGKTLDRVSNALMYRIHGCETIQDGIYSDILENHEKKAVKANALMSFMPPVYQIISLVSVIPIIWIGAKNVFGTGWTMWDIAAFTSFLSCYMRLSVKASKSAKLFNSVQRAQVSWHRIKPFLVAAHLPDVPVPAKPKTLKANDLSVSYADKNIFSGVYFIAKPGSIIGITGPVACGKTTLGLSLLCDIPYSGSLKYGDKELKDIPEKDRREIFAYMSHDPELMNMTVEENVLLGDEKNAIPFISAAGMEAEIKEMPEGIKTHIQSAGERLSGGQQARVALARTLCHRRPVTILDDPFSSLDLKTEKEVFSEVKQLCGDGIVIIISHRLLLFPLFDSVVMLGDGAPKTGTHEEMMKLSEKYAQLYTDQITGGEKNEEK